MKKLKKSEDALKLDFSERASEIKRKQPIHDERLERIEKALREKERQVRDALRKKGIIVKGSLYSVKEGDL